MSGFHENPLIRQLQQYLSPQSPDPVQSASSVPQSNHSGTRVYEIRNNDDLIYIRPDDTGQKQIIVCDSEKTIYVARYNYATEKPDYEKYISEGNIELFKKSDNNEAIGQIATAMSAILDEIKTMRAEIHDVRGTVAEMKETKPVVPETKPPRNSNGQFKKKGE